MDQNDPIYSKSVLDMFTVANEYCIFLEKTASYDPETIYTYLHRVLPLLYLKGSTVPLVQAKYPEANERYVTEEHWQGVFNELKTKFAQNDTFYFSDPRSENEEADRFSLAENLADIYQDVKDFVLLFSKESHAARENAIQEIARLFKSHWGHRILLCQIQTHFLLYQADMNEDRI